MTARTASRLARSLLGLSFAIGAIGASYLVVSRSEPFPAGSFGFRGFTLLFVVAYGVVGALVASRHPSNPIGWLYLAVALLSSVQELAQDYALYSSSRGGLRFGEVASWAPAWIWVPATGTMAFVLLLFPDGRLLSPRWRSVAAMGILGITIGTAGFMLTPGPIENFRTLDNPFGIGSRASLQDIGGVGLLLYGLGTILAAVSLAIRFRRSTGDERVPLKWLVASGLALAFVLTLSFVGQALPISERASLWLSVAVIASFVSLPVATAFAILKYHLYDIDLVINKAVVYGALAAFITLVYVGIVARIGTVIGSRGHVVLSAIAAATVALAFQPARRWAQRLANRVVYGRRATPYEVLSELAGRFCVLEALQNVAKYANASRVDIALRDGDGRLAFEVRDDGVGFDPAARPGSGLQGMADRLEAVGGALEVSSDPGLGTTVTGRVPVPVRGQQ